MKNILCFLCEWTENNGMNRTVQYIGQCVNRAQRSYSTKKHTSAQGAEPGLW